MIREKVLGKPSIDISGPAGNAFNLMGVASSIARKMELDEDAIISDMMSGDYEHLLEVFDKHFGNYIDLVR